MIWYKNLDRFFFRFVTILAFDRQIDGQTRQTEFSSLDRVCILQRVKTFVPDTIR